MSNEKWDLEFNLKKIIHYNNWISAHTTTSLTPRYVRENFNINLIREKV